MPHSSYYVPLDKQQELQMCMEGNATVQNFPAQWDGHHSKKIRTQKRHIGPHQTSEQLNAVVKSAARRHFPPKMSEPFVYRRHMRVVGPKKVPEVKPEDVKITEIPIPIKQKEDKDINDLYKMPLQKYQGVKQLQNRDKIASQRAKERAKRTFTDTGISIMTLGGQRSFTQDSAQEFKRMMNEEKAARTLLKK